jgi:hypothetical protein
MAGIAVTAQVKMLKMPSTKAAIARPLVLVIGRSAGAEAPGNGELQPLQT